MLQQPNVAWMLRIEYIMEKKILHQPREVFSIFHSLLNSEISRHLFAKMQIPSAITPLICYTFVLKCLTMIIFRIVIQFSSF